MPVERYELAQFGFVQVRGGPERHAVRRPALQAVNLPVWFTWEQGSNLTVVVHLDVSRLHFQTVAGRRTQKLTIGAVLRDSSGSFVTGKRSEFDLNLTDATFQQAKNSFHGRDDA